LAVVAVQDSVLVVLAVLVDFVLAQV